MKPRALPLNAKELSEEREQFLARRAIKDNDAMERAAKRSRQEEAIRRDKMGWPRRVEREDDE